MTISRAQPEPSHYRRDRGYPRITGEGMVGAEGKRYFAHPDLITAVNVALACRMPLLLTGEPGCGKTDFAHAVAGELARRAGGDGRDRSLLDCAVRSDTRARDLLYHYDAVRRFGDAQLRSAALLSSAGGRSATAVPDDHPAHYITLQGLGLALASAYQRVVLIDEIDKAPRDLPNDLLRPLEKWTYDIAEIPADAALAVGGIEMRQRMGPPGEAPLVIVTSNVERQLPEPFLRRCVFHHIQFPDEAQLLEILASHHPEGTDPPMRKAMVELFGGLRTPAARLGKRPGTAELLAWAEALVSVFEPNFVRERLGALREKLAATVSVGGAMDAVPWGALPALSCLVKLREDLERLRVGLPAAGGAG